MAAVEVHRNPVQEELKSKENGQSVTFEEKAVVIVPEVSAGLQMQVPPSCKNTEKSDSDSDDDSSPHEVKVENLAFGSTENIEVEKGMTLLEKALMYRQENPEKWENRKQEDEILLKESYGIYRDDPFLSNYYKRLDQIFEEGEKLEEMRKNEPPKLMVMVEYNEPRPPSAKKRNSTDTYASLAANGVSVYDKEENFFDMFKKQSSEERGAVPEFLITVTKGKNFNNIFQDREPRLQECRLKCKLFPDSLKHGPKQKTEYVYCNYKGTTKWNHVFVLKGFTAKELVEKHVVLEAVGKTEDGKEVIGRAIIAGKNATIESNQDKNFRPSESQCSEWHQALDKPGLSITVNVHLENPKEKQNTIKSLFRQEVASKDKKTPRKKSSSKSKANK